MLLKPVMAEQSMSSSLSKSKQVQINNAITNNVVMKYCLYSCEGRAPGFTQTCIVKRIYVVTFTNFFFCYLDRLNKRSSRFLDNNDVIIHASLYYNIWATWFSP